MTTELGCRASGHAGNSPGQGPFIKIHLLVAEGVIREANYETYQCPGCHACGKAIVELVTGKSVDAARTLVHADLVGKVGPLPKHRQICYGLTLLALNSALSKIDSGHSET